METNGCGASCINVNNKLHNIIIHNMVRGGIIDSNQHEKLRFAEETPVEVYRCKIHIALDNTSPNFASCGKITSIY